MLEVEQNNIWLKVIDFLRLPLAICVVFIHCYGSPWRVDYSQIDYSALTGMDCFNILRALMSYIIPRFAVPLFFLISGYLFYYKATHFTLNVYFEKLKRRVHSLIIPYLIWNLIAIVVVYRADIFMFVQGENSSLSFLNREWFRLFWDCEVFAMKVNWLGILQRNTAPVNLPLWFLRDLIVVSFFTPLIYIFIKYMKKCALAILGILYVTGIWVDIPGFSITAFFFFSIGAYFSINNISVLNVLGTYKIFNLIITLILTIVSVIWYDTPRYEYISPFYVISSSVTVINIAAIMVEQYKLRIPRMLSQGTFFIYVTHLLTITSISFHILSYVLNGDSPMVLTLRYITVPFLTIGICESLYLILRWLMPRFISVTTGSR